MVKIINKKNLEVMEEEEHKVFHRRLVYVLVVMLILLFGSATFYHIVEGWRYLDAVYFSTETMTTIGFGDITPKTDAGKVFTIFFAFTGVGIVLYGLSLMASHFVEVREEFWLERLGKIRIKHHTASFWGKLKNFLNYKGDTVVKSYEKSVARKK